jgi:isoleucyl-tRNA synthetase
VREVFVRLYEEGLIYKGDYIINWCPRCQTALADLEVEHEPTDGHLFVPVALTGQWKRMNGLLLDKIASKLRSTVIRFPDLPLIPTAN